MTEPTATALPGPYEQETIEAFRRPEPFSVPALVTALLLVADTTHNRPGDRGEVTFDEWWMSR